VLLGARNSVPEVWTVTRTIAWAATATHAPGRQTRILCIAPDGIDLGGGMSSGDEFPGQH
jgi:hypothetical protein